MKLIADHLVPISVMVGALFGGPIELTRDGIGTHLVVWYRSGLLLHGENVRHDARGLLSVTPAHWDGEPVFAHYASAGIEQANDVNRGQETGHA